MEKQEHTLFICLYPEPSELCAIKDVHICVTFQAWTQNTIRCSFGGSFLVACDAMWSVEVIMHLLP